VRCIQVGANRNKRRKVQYRAHLLKGQRIVSGGTSPYAFLNLQYKDALLQQQWAEMQQILPTELIFRPGCFKHIKIDQGAKCQRKLQRQPAPARKIAAQPDVNAQHPGHPQNDGCQRQAKKPVCSLVNPFGEPQQQGKSQPDKYRSQEGQVIGGDMERVCIQLVLLLQSLFQVTNILIYRL
jgi:hypothetical protein